MTVPLAIWKSMTFGQMGAPTKIRCMRGSRFVALLVKWLAGHWVTAPKRRAGAYGFRFLLRIELIFATLTSGQHTRRSFLMACMGLAAKSRANPTPLNGRITHCVSVWDALFARHFRFLSPLLCTGSVYTYFCIATTVRLLAAEVEPLPCCLAVRRGRYPHMLRERARKIESVTEACFYRNLIDTIG